MKRAIQIVILGFLSGVGGAYTYSILTDDNNVPAKNENMPAMRVNNPDQPTGIAREISMDEDFVAASATSTESVVYIKNISEYTYSRSYLDWFFDRSPGSQTRISSGSGVIYSKDGYIVTNNHVVQDADQLEVVVGKQTFTAELIGTDPSTDLAVLKIEADNLPAIPLGNSHDLQVGEWVIAVGNPFNLTSTVTAGIVSAKGRQINILQSKFPIESFIQTDAAINPGNSGGALVDKDGNLVGINTAILSRTGSYAGYGFAVPIDIVKKIVDDLIEYGEVQKAFFGGDVSDYNSEIAKRLDMDINPNGKIAGVILSYVQEDGAAHEAGLREGDVILKMDGEELDSESAFKEILSYHSPGDEVAITYSRDGSTKTTNITLTNREGTTGILKREIYVSETLGAQFETVPKVERDLLGINYGVRVFNIERGLFQELGVSEDFVITDINRNAIKDPERLVNILENIRGRVIIEGVNAKGREGYYSFILR